MSAVKEIVRGVLPERAIWEINHRLGRTWTKEIDLDAAAVFAEADLEALRSPRRLEELLPRLGLNDDVPAWMPSELQPFLGKGLRVWQYPNQFGPYLASLAGLHIRSYLEIGVQHGGSFAATLTFLERLNGPLVKAIAADMAYAPGVARFARARANVQQLVIHSATPEFRAIVAGEGPFDLAMIDGDHSYDGVLNDFESVRDHANVIAFHDIVDGNAEGVVRAWREIRADHADVYEFREFTDQYAEVTARHAGQSFFGIGVALRRQRL